MIIICAGRQDVRHAYPPPIPLSQSKQNISKSSNLIPLKRTHSTTNNNLQPITQQTPPALSTSSATDGQPATDVALTVNAFDGAPDNKVTVRRFLVFKRLTV